MSIILITIKFGNGQYNVFKSKPRTKQEFNAIKRAVKKQWRNAEVHVGWENYIESEHS